MLSCESSFLVRMGIGDVEEDRDAECLGGGGGMLSSLSPRGIMTVLSGPVCLSVNDAITCFLGFVPLTARLFPSSKFLACLATREQTRHTCCCGTC
jgi:hypothetical protein